MPADASKGCRLAPIPATASSWTFPYNPSQVNFDGQGNIAVTLVRGQGPRLSSKDVTGYGLYSVSAKLCKEYGCISAFYVSLSQGAALKQKVVHKCMPACQHHRRVLGRIITGLCCRPWIDESPAASSELAAAVNITWLSPARQSKTAAVHCDLALSLLSIGIGPSGSSYSVSPAAD